MKNFKALPTNNTEWGFWGTSIHNDYDAELTWDVTSCFLAEHFELNPEQTRDVLDSRFGRHLADDLSFIKNSPLTTESINKHLTSRINDKGWRGYFEKAIREETGKTYPHKNLITKDELFTKIAHEYLNIETLEERKADSLDFYNVGIWDIKAALAAAFEAGKLQAKKKEA